MRQKSRDEEIIDAIRTGNNTSALNHLYASALPNVVKFIIRNNGDKEEAKDIFQDAVVALFSTIRLGKYDASKEINAFLYHVARNLWINRIKKKNKQTNIEDTQEFHEENTPVTYLIDDEKQAAVKQLMDKMGAACKELLKYVMHDKLSMKEVAEKMGFAGETVAKATHYRCKQKLAALVFENKNIMSLLRE